MNRPFNIRDLVKRKAFFMLTAAAALISIVSSAAVPLQAQTATLSLDARHSTAQFFIGSPVDPYSFSPGFADVSGKVALNFEAPGRSVVNIQIYPAGAKVRDGVVQTDLAEYATLSFASKGAVLLTDGRLVVIGDLALKKVIRPVTATPNEGYAGPIYGEPEARTIHQTSAFVFPHSFAMSESSDGHRQRISAISTFSYEQFPQLMPTLMKADWPLIVQDESFVMPGQTGEDYSGPTYSGIVVAPTNRTVATSSVGEDFSGPHIAAAAGNQVVIKLNLVLSSQSESALMATGK